MKLSDEIAMISWAFDDHRADGVRSLANKVRVMERRLEELRSPSLVLDTGLKAEPYTAQPGELRPVTNPDLRLHYKLLELQAGVRNLGRMLNDTANASIRMGLDRQADVLRGFEREVRVLLGAEPAEQANTERDGD